MSDPEPKPTDSGSSTTPKPSSGKHSLPQSGSVPLRRAESPPEPPKQTVEAPVSTRRLPPLPIPKLDQTCRRFLEVVAGVLTPEELDSAKQETEAFLQSDGARLDAVLQQWAPEEGNRSYVERYWYKMYLRGRDPLVVNSNPFFVLEEDPTPSRNSQIERATSLIISCLKFHQAVISGTLEEDSQRGIPLCMLQYGMLFHATRIPDAKCDTVERYPDSRHIVVMCRGQLYWFNVYAEDGKSCLPPEEIAANLRLIRDDAWSVTDADAMRCAVGVLTTEDRTVWARARESIVIGDGLDSAGADSLYVMDSALFVVCLDHASPHTLSEQSNNFLHGTSRVEAGIQSGTCLNRWYDKSLQIIVCENGSAGVNFEHSHLDGHTVLRFASDVFTDTILRFAQTIRGALPSLKGTLPDVPFSTAIDSTPQKIVWRLSPEVLHGIRRAEAKLSDLINRTEVECLEFTGFGKAAITDLNSSPDAFVQVAFQLAYYRLYGELRSTYETVMTKMYDHGRTEAQRSCTPEALAFCRAFCSDLPVNKKVEAYRAAMRAQGHGVKLCGEGLGVDRHLYSLKCLAEERDEAVPAFFNSKAWRTMTHNILSTSNCGNPSLRLFGFGPVVPDGFGIGYLIKNDGVQFSVSSFRRQTARFLELLQMSMTDMRAMLLCDKPKVKPTNKLPAGSVSLGGGGGGGSGGMGGMGGAGGSNGGAFMHQFTPRIRTGPSPSMGRQQSYQHPEMPGSTSPPHAFDNGSGQAVARMMWASMLTTAETPTAKRQVLNTIATMVGIPLPSFASVESYDGNGSSPDVDRWLQTAAETFGKKH